MQLLLDAVPAASSKRKHPDSADPVDIADVLPELSWRELKDLCKGAVKLDLSNPEGLDEFRSSAETLISAFGIVYEDCWGKIYTRHGAPTFAPRVKIIMEVSFMQTRLRLHVWNNFVGWIAYTRQAASVMQSCTSAILGFSGNG